MEGPTRQLITFEQLHTFRTLVSAGSFNNAAEVLFLSQPAISQRITQLEQALGVELLHRDGNRRVLRLTSAGERVLRFTDRVYELLDQLREELRVSSAANWEPVNIACSPTPAKYLLPILLALYLERYPHTKVNLVQCIGEKINEKINTAVLSNKAELGIQVDYFVDKRLEAVPIATDYLELIAPPDHPIVANADWWLISEHRCSFVLPLGRTFIRQVAEQWAAKVKVKLQATMEASTIDALKEAVIRGLGLTIVPRSTVAAEVQDGRLAVVQTPGLPWEFCWCLVYRNDHSLSPSAGALLNLVREITNQTKLFSPVIKAGSGYT